MAHVLKAMTSGVHIKGLLLDKMLESGIQCEAEVKVCDIDHISESKFTVEGRIQHGCVSICAS